MHKISEWEKAIKHRPKIQFDEIYLKEGLVNTVIGNILVPCRKVRGEIRMRRRKVRWNKYGLCFTINGIADDSLEGYNINFKRATSV